jgi:hypothetical protein
MRFSVARLLTKMTVTEAALISRQTRNGNRQQKTAEELLFFRNSPC